MYLLEDMAIVGHAGWREAPRSWGAQGASSAPLPRMIERPDPEFPALARAIEHRPTRLWVRGSVIPEDALAVAIVGSRRATPQGLAVAERLAGDLAARGGTLVRGVARGVAH